MDGGTGFGDSSIGKEFNVVNVQGFNKTWTIMCVHVLNGHGTKKKNSPR